VANVRIAGATALLGGAILLLVLGVAVGTPRVSSHHDAIAVVLRRHDVAFDQITTEQPWPVAFNYYAYGAAIAPYQLAVTVQRPGAPPLGGSFECADGMRRCVLTLLDAGIIAAPAPDIAPPPAAVLERWYAEVRTIAQRAIR